MLNVSNHIAKIVLLRAQKKHGKIKIQIKLAAFVFATFENISHVFYINQSGFPPRSAGRFPAPQFCLLP
jgi:hypothetical protein